MWIDGTNDKYRTVASKLVNWEKMINWAKKDRLTKCIYLVLTENRFLTFRALLAL